MIKNIIFDFDGVIVDSEVLVGRAFSKYLKNLGHNFEEKYPIPEFIDEEV